MYGQPCRLVTTKGQCIVVVIDQLVAMWDTDPKRNLLAIKLFVVFLPDKPKEILEGLFFVLCS
jgi:hypothetical protein